MPITEEPENMLKLISKRSRKHGPPIPLHRKRLRALCKLYKELTGATKFRKREMLHYFCKITDLGVTSLHDMIAIKYQAYGDDDYKSPAKRICALLGVSPEDFFGMPDNLEWFYDFNFESIPVPPFDIDYKDIVRLALKKLKKHDNVDGLMEKVIKLRHGIDCTRAHSLDEIGKILTSVRTGKPVSRQRINQIEAKALKILRDAINAILKEPIINNKINEIEEPHSENLEELFKKISTTAA